MKKLAGKEVKKSITNFLLVLAFLKHDAPSHINQTYAVLENYKNILV